MPKASFMGHAMGARCRADIETVTPQSGQDWRWRGSLEHTCGREHKRLKKRRKRREGEKKKKNNNQALT